MLYREGIMCQPPIYRTVSDIKSSPKLGLDSQFVLVPRDNCLAHADFFAIYNRLACAAVPLGSNGESGDTG